MSTRFYAQGNAVRGLIIVMGLLTLGYLLHVVRLPSDEQGNHLQRFGVPLALLAGACCWVYVRVKGWRSRRIRCAFWLNREGEEVCGPFAPEQLRSMWSQGVLTLNAQVMPEGGQWRPIQELLERMKEKKRKPLSATEGLLVVAIGIFWLAWSNERQAQTDPLNLYRSQISRAKAWVKDQARDPRTVSYNAVGAGESGHLYVVTLDFSWENGLGGKSRKRYRFGYGKNTGQLELVKDEDTGEMVVYGGAIQAPVEAEQNAEAKANEGKVDARVSQALEMASGAPTVPVKAMPLPAVPGLGN